MRKCWYEYKLETTLIRQGKPPVVEFSLTF